MLLTGVLTGCSSSSGAVRVVAASPTGSAAAQCARLVSSAPATVDGQSRRPVSPTSRFVAAWGDPAIVVTCSGTRPAALTRTSQCFRIAPVDWLVTQHGREVDPRGQLVGTLDFTTVGRSAYVTVLVPDAYQPASDALVDLGATIVAATTAVHPCV